ncbi:MAG: hypothetical protein ABIR60_08710 [Allosphingosinicella sp.]
MPGGFIKAAMSSVMPMGLGGLGGVLTAVIDAKLLATKPMISGLSKVAIGALGAAMLRKRPALAYGFAGGVLGSLGYSLGLKVAGGLVAPNGKAALKGIADLASEDPEMAALLEGVGDLVPDDNMGDENDGMGDATDDYAAALGDSDDDGNDMGDLVDA